MKYSNKRKSMYDALLKESSESVHTWHIKGLFVPDLWPQGPATMRAVINAMRARTALLQRLVSCGRSCMFSDLRLKPLPYRGL